MRFSDTKMRFTLALPFCLNCPTPFQVSLLVKHKGWTQNLCLSWSFPAGPVPRVRSNEADLVNNQAIVLTKIKCHPSSSFKYQLQLK